MMITLFSSSKIFRSYWSFYVLVILYEDELDDNGCSKLSVKIVSYVFLAREHSWVKGSINGRSPIYLNWSKEEKLLLFVCAETTEYKAVKLEISGYINVLACFLTRKSNLQYIHLGSYNLNTICAAKNVH